MFRIQRRTLAVLLLGGIAAGAALAQSRPVAYVGQGYNTSNAYLFDWQGSTRAGVVASEGRTGATVLRSGTQRLLTLDTPFSAQTYAVDVDPCIGTQPLVQRDVLQLAVVTTSGTDSRGTSKVVEIGTETTLEGCAPGTVTPFGAPTDPGLATRHLALSLRPSVADLLPGVALAGPSEAPRDPATPFIAQDVLTLQAGGLGSFAASGHVVPAGFDADQWLVLAVAGGERAYARLFVDRLTGAETWLDVERSGGVPQVAYARLMVKPVAGASFGGLRRASRMWQSGLSTTPTSAFLIYLYQTGAGERVLVDTAAGTESRTPISWTFAGANIRQTRALGSTSTGVRTWQPLANNGGRATFVIEDEVRVAADGTVLPFIAPRVNFYTDTGAATPP